MKYDVYWADKKALKIYESLSSFVHPRIKEVIQGLSLNPRPPGVKKLSGKLAGAWRLRIGDYRLLYDIDDKKKEIILLELGHRRQIYR